MADPFDDNLLTSMNMTPVGMSLGEDAFNFGAPRMSIDGSGPSPRSIASVPIASTPASHATRAGLTYEAVDDLCLVYETFIHPHWPVIYVPALRSLRSLETQQPLVFDAILAVSAAHTAHTRGSVSPLGRFSSGTGRPMSEVCDYLTDSVRQRILGSTNSREFIPSLQAVQALIMITLVDIGSGRTSLAYQMGGFACRMAVDLGLHSDYSDYTPTPRSRDSRTSQERSRTLWACFIVDKILASVSQKPPSLRLVDIDAPRPSIMERDELDLWLSGNAGHHFVQPQFCETMESIKSHTLSSFNAWCDVMAILEMILSQIYRTSTRRARMEGRHVDGYEETVMHIDSELCKWRESLPAHLQWSDDDPHAHDNVGLHFLTCRGWYHICMLLLHRPQVPFLDTAETPDSGGTDVANPNATANTHVNRHPSEAHRLPNAAQIASHSATALCKMMESYENTFRMRKFASSWVYLVFQAATVHAGLAGHIPSSTAATDLSLNRTESLHRLEQCIRWLDRISMQWSSAGRHVEILRKLSAVGARTRPPSPTSDGLDLQSYVGAADAAGTVAAAPGSQFDPALGTMNEIPLDLNAWMLLWASMPAAGDDISLWQQCFPTVT